jgi:hypothetical protein
VYSNEVREDGEMEDDKEEEEDQVEGKTNEYKDAACEKGYKDDKFKLLRDGVIE